MEYNKYDLRNMSQFSNCVLLHDMDNNCSLMVLITYLKHIKLNLSLLKESNNTLGKDLCESKLDKILKINLLIIVSLLPI